MVLVLLMGGSEIQVIETPDRVACQELAFDYLNGPNHNGASAICSKLEVFK